MGENNLKKRIRNAQCREKIMSAEEAASFIRPGMTIGSSGFTPAGYPKMIPAALAKRAEAGEKLDLTLLTGASTGDEMDGVLARAGVIRRRIPYQTNKDLRDAINRGEISYMDMHLSQLPNWVKNGYLGKVHVAVVEATAIDENGNIIPTTSVGCANTYVACADQVIVEINTTQPPELEGIHDIYSPKKAPDTEPIPITKTEDRIGTTYIPCTPDKIRAIVISDIPDNGRPVAAIDETSQKIADNLVQFLKDETKAGRLPAQLPPLQSGVGSVANAVLAGLKDSDFENINIYSEVLQDAVFDLMDAGKVACASGTSLTISPAKREEFYAKFPAYRDKIVLRPQEISNSPEVIRRLGVIAVNTVIEADIYGNTNSSHIGGSRLMNGLGGSGDFGTNAGLSIYITPATAKKGTVSSIVPFVTHVDHTEHDIHALITEYGVADIRGLSPIERAHKIIDNCAAPEFREELNAYLEEAIAQSTHKQTPHVLHKVFK